MRVRLDTQNLGVLAHLGLPSLCPANVEALITRQAVYERSRLLSEAKPIGFIGNREPRIIRNVLTEGELAIDVVAGHRLVGAVLGSERRRLRGESVVILFREPSAQISLCVKLTALIVETVTDLVADD